MLTTKMAPSRWSILWNWVALYLYLTDVPENMVVPVNIMLLADAAYDLYERWEDRPNDQYHEIVFGLNVFRLVSRIKVLGKVFYA